MRERLHVFGAFSILRGVGLRTQSLTQTYTECPQGRFARIGPVNANSQPGWSAPAGIFFVWGYGRHVLNLNRPSVQNEHMPHKISG